MNFKNDQEVLAGMVTAARKALVTGDQLRSLGYRDTPYDEIYDTLADAIYAFLGENVDPFSDSVTYRVLNNESLTTEQRVNVLLYEYNIKHARPIR